MSGHFDRSGATSARLFREELLRMVRSGRFVGSIALGFALVATSALLGHMSYAEWAGFARVGDTKTYEMVNRVAGMYWAGVDGRPSSGLLCLLLPLLCLLPGAGTLIEDRASGFLDQALACMDDVSFYVAKAGACFVSAFLAAIAPLLISIVFASMAAPWGNPDPSGYWSFMIPIDFSTPLRDLFFTRPLWYMVAWSLLSALLCGAWSVAVLGASLFASSPVRLFISSFLTQLVISYLSAALMKFSDGTFMGSFDLFTQIMPRGYETAIPTVETMVLCMVAFLAIATIVPVLFFRGRCYL